MRDKVIWRGGAPSFTLLATRLPSSATLVNGGQVATLQALAGRAKKEPPLPSPNTSLTLRRG